MRCPQCGAENHEGAAFCSLCFARFGAQPAVPPPQAEPPAASPEQPLPPGAVPPPGPGMPLPPAQPVKVINPTLMWLIRVTVVVVCFAIGWYGMDWFLTRPRTFNSPTSAISFTYPGKWKKVTGTGFGIAAAANTSGQMTAEVELADGNSETNANYYLAVGSSKGLTTDFETIKSRLRETDPSVLTANMPSGSTVTGLTFTDTTIAGAPAVSMKYTASFSGYTSDCDVTFIQSGNTLYLLAFRAKKPKGTGEKFQELLRTVKFKT